MSEGKEGRKKTRGRTRRGAKVWGSWGDAECIFMSLCLSSFWVVWSRRHKFFSPPHPPFLHLSFHLSSCLPEGPLLKSSPIFSYLVCKLSPSFHLYFPSSTPPDVSHYLSILLPFSSLSLFVYCKLTQQFSVWLFSPPLCPPQHHHTHPL